MTDRAALKAIKTGDEAALSVLIERYAAYVGAVMEFGCPTHYSGTGS